MAKKKKFGKKFSPQPMTPKQKADVERQRQERQQKREGPGEVEVRRKKTRKEVVALESDPTRRKQLQEELTPEVKEPLKGTQLFQSSRLRRTLKEPLTKEQVIGGVLGGAAIATGGIALAGAGLGAGAVLSRAAAGQIPKSITPVIKGGQIAANTKNAARTTTWLSKLVTNPTVLVSAIGSYPFAGFIKEEALQTLSFGVNTAQKNNDIEGAELALQKQREILNPDVWSQIFASIPYANLLAQLKDFYKAANTKLEIDEKTVQKMREKLKNV